MSDTIRRPAPRSFYDRDAIAKYLEAMSAKGWQLESMGQYLWTYRRAEPRALRYAVAYYDTSAWDGVEPVGDMSEFFELCAHQGWQPVARCGGMQVFSSELDDPVPLETDPAVELSAVHKAAKRRIVLGCGVIAAIGAVVLSVLLREMYTDPLGTLSSFWAAQVGLFFVLFGLISLAELIYYYAWHAAASRVAATGVWANTRALCRATRFFDACVLVLAALLLASLFSLRTFEALDLGLRILSLLLALMAGNLVQDLLESAGKSRRLSFVVNLIVCVVVALAINSGEFFLTDNHGLYGEGDATLTLAELTGEDVPTYRKGDDQASFLLARLSVVETEIYEPVGKEPAELTYDVNLVRAAALYGFCESFASCGGVEIDPAPWGALRAYQTGENSYTLCYADRIVEITLPLSPTPAQRTLVGEKLGG